MILGVIYGSVFRREKDESDTASIFQGRGQSSLFSFGKACGKMNIVMSVKKSEIKISGPMDTDTYVRAHIYPVHKESRNI
jgi:hypothetical protein